MLAYPSFDPIAFHVGEWGVHWYGLMYLLGFVAFRLLAESEARDRRLRITTAEIDDMLFYGVVGVVLGGRLGYVLFYQPDYYLEHLSEIVMLWHGGMSFHGGLLGVALAIYAYSRRSQWSFLYLTDFIAPIVPIGLGAGRIGNFINGELWGRVTDPVFPFAMVFPLAGDNLPRHPSQLYELGLEGFGLFLILQCVARLRLRDGSVTAAFLVFYGCARFLVEFTREPDSFLGILSLGLTMGQWLSIPMILSGGLLWRYAQRH